MSITPYILGKGRSGQAIAKSLAALAIQKPELKLAPAIWLERGTRFSDLKHDPKHPVGKSVLCISNPHGLHTQAILDAEHSGFDGILCEKPACVNLEQIEQLRRIKTPTAIFHGYQLAWGVQQLKQMIVEGKLGDLITIESRYWQSSAAERALSPSGDKGWKDDTTLAGEYDTLMDLGTHFVDAVSFLYGEIPASIQGWKSYANGGSPHRDTHVHLTLEYSKGRRALGSVSKTVHGATNQFELNVLGTRGTASWSFLQPDEVLIGEGRDRRVVTRKTTELGSQQSPFHGMGWLEGYIEISSRLLHEIAFNEGRDYPKLPVHLDLLTALLKTTWHD